MTEKIAKIRLRIRTKLSMILECWIRSVESLRRFTKKVRSRDPIVTNTIGTWFH